MGFFDTQHIPTIDPNSDRYYNGDELTNKIYKVKQTKISSVNIDTREIISEIQRGDDFFIECRKSEKEGTIKRI